jgi:predicted AlkP superfamily pyrophosphatase or phosphodiesterase
MAKTADTNSKCYTVALDPLSAILLTGRNGVGFWPENNKTHWTTSSAYLHTTPEWVAEYNRNGNNAMYMLKRWTPICPAASYLNSEVAVIEDIKNKSTKLLTDIHHRLGNSAIDDMRYSPAGNTILLEFASTLIAQERLGADSAPDILNICLDTSRYIASAYGPESMEYEDMLYRLDRDLAEFLTYLYAQVDDPQKIVVVLTADHGTSPSYNPIGGKHRERFNVRQMEVIVNAFLGARYGSENYVLGFANNAIYLNHQTILEKRLSLESIREEVATFLLQMRGVATAISASSLRNTSFADGRTRLLQQSFYATRSGDVVVDFMPGWIIEDSATRSASDAGYNYDRKVPLIIYGTTAKGRYDKAVSIVEVAPTITALLGIEQPWASTANPLKECITTK